MFVSNTVVLWKLQENLDPFYKRKKTILHIVTKAEQFAVDMVSEWELL
jgi:hypothetical protein